MIDDKYLNEVCKMGQGADCCAYLIVGPKGIECAKGTEFEAEILGRIERMIAKSDNCKGYHLREVVV
jgi:hypothetical protein